jgi:hypothetical protein
LDPVVFITDPLGGLVDTGLGDADAETDGVADADGAAVADADGFDADAGFGTTAGPDATAEATEAARITMNPPMARDRRNPGASTPSR